jgi:uncharacterized protein
LIYLDTSALASIYVPEPASDRIERLVAAEPVRAISDLAEVEMYSAISRRLRMRELSRPHASAIVSSFEADLAGRAFRVIALDSSHFRTARGLIARFDNGLRTLDALHLSVVATSGFELVTLDQSMAKAARAIGVTVRRIRA